MALVFPMFMFSVVIIRSVILFKRGAIRNKEVRLYFAPSPCGVTDIRCSSSSSSGGPSWAPLKPLSSHVLQAFNSMVDKMMARSPVNGLNVYPEGMRLHEVSLSPASPSHQDSALSVHERLQAADIQELAVSR